MRRAVHLSVLLLVATLAGCIESSSPDGLSTTENPRTASGKPHVVVAVFDSGINPYAPVFRAVGFPEPREIIPDLPPYETVVLSFDLPYAEALEADKIAALQRDRLYWFKDTRILGYAHDDLEDVRYPVIDESGHGTAVASLIAKTDPNAIILAIETFGEIENAIAWVANESWVDVLSISVGVIGNLPVEYAAGDEGRAEYLRVATTNGKLVIGAAGNEFVPPLASSYQGPPWTVGVGGGSSTYHSDDAVASKVPDVVADDVVEVARHDTTADEWRWDAGTSFSAPIVSGVLSKSIYAVRSAWNYSGNIVDGALAAHDGKRLTNADLRAALNATAIYWSPGEYSPGVDPTCPVCTYNNSTIPYLPEVPGTPVGPWIQAGWGFVNASTADRIVAILLGKEPNPARPSGAVEFMETIFAARVAYWDLPRPPRP